MQQQQQQHADYDLLAVFTDEAKADTAAAKLRKEGFGEDEVHQLPIGAVGTGQFREHGPDRNRGDFFLQTQRTKPNPLIVILLAVTFGILLSGLTFVSSFAFPTFLPEPTSAAIGIVVGIVLGIILGRRGRLRGAIGQDIARAKAPPSRSVQGARTVVALRFPNPDNISRKSRARAILLNSEGKIDRSVGRQE